MPKLYFTAGYFHECGRSSPPTRFEANRYDPRPHAFVSVAFGEHLMTVEPGRYEWEAPDLAPALGLEATLGNSPSGGGDRATSADDAALSEKGMAAAITRPKRPRKNPLS